MGRLKCLLLKLIFFELAWADCPRPIIHTDIVSEDCPNGRNTFGCKYTLACQLGYLPSFPDRYPNMIGSFSCGEDGNWHDDKGVEVAITDADPNMLACIPGCLYPAPNETSLYVVEAPPSEIYTFPDRKNNNQPMQWIYGGINFTLRCTGDHVVLQKTMTSDIMLADYTCIQRPNVNNPYFYSSSITNGENILNNCQKSCLFNADNKQGSVEEISGTRAWRDGGILNFNCIQNTAFKAGSSAFGREYERLRCDAKNNHLIDTFSEMAVTQSPCVQNLIPGQCFWPAIDNVEVISTTCQNTTVGVKAECTMSLRCKQGFRPTNLKFLTPTGSEAITCKDGQGWVDETGQQAAFIQCEQGCIREVLTVGDLESISHNLPISNGSLFSATCRNLTIYKKPLPDHPYYCLDLGNTGSCSMSCRSPQPLPSGVVIVNKNDNHTFLWAASPFNMWIFANGTAIYKCEEGYYYPEDSSPAQHGQTQRVHCDWDSVMTDPDTGVANPTLVACVPITGCRIIDPGWSANITNETSSCVRDDVKREYNNGCTLKYDCNAGTYPNEAQYVAANGQEITCKSGKWFNILGEVVTKSLACQHGCASFNLPDYIRTMVSNSTGLKVLSVNYTDTAGAVHSSTLTLAFAEVLNRTQIGQNRYYCSFVNTSIILAAEIARALSCKDSCLTVDLTTAPTNPNLITMPANFTTELNQTYVGINGTYEFECPAGKVVPGQESGYKQKLICGPDSFFVNPDTNEVIKTRNLTGLKACTETDVCSLPNKTSTNNVISTDCQIVTIPKTGLKYNCTVNITCLPGYFPVTTTVGSFDIIQVVCGKPTNVTGSRWIDIKTGEELSLNCTPGVCPAPVNSTSVSVTSNCVITNGAVTNNCTVMEQCKEGFFSVDSTGMTGSTRSSFCDTTKLNNSTLTNIVIGTVLPPLNCTEKAQCEIPKTTATTTTNSTTCIIANGKVNYGCTVTEQCLKGYYPVNSRGVVNNVRTYNCTAFDDKNSILIDITTGEILPSLNCTKPCANLILSVGTTLTSSCVVQKNGYTVGCNASLVCDNGLQVNISGRITTVRNVRCDKIDDTNSTFIDILTGQPVDLSPCVCPVNIPNSTIIKSDCIRVGQGGPPGCSIDKTCAPGTAPIWTENRLPTNISLVCGKPNGTSNYAWIEIKTGEASQLDDCHEVCPAVTVANAHVTTTCTLLDGDYQIGCTATVECDQGFQGINSKYNFASKLNITCKGVASNNSTFIEITTGEPLLREICGTPPQAPLVCKLINTTNVRTDSTCYIAGAGAPLGCQANVTCIPGTIPVYTNETVSSSVTVYYCNGTADRNNKSWIEITSGAPLEDKSCWPPCPEVTLPGTKFNTSCTLLNGGFQVGCNATLICDEDYFPINTTSGTNLVANLVCKSHNNTASTWTNIMTGEPVREGPCIKPECGLLNNTNTVVGSSCYYAGKGAALDCVANVTCIPGMYPVYTTSGFNTTDHLKCEKKKGQVNATWIRITTGEVVKGDECQSSCPNVIYPATKFNSSCGTLKDGGFQVGCNATLVCEETYLPIDTESGTNPVTNIVCKKLNTTTSVWVKITTGEPATKPPCEVTATTPKPTTLKPPEKCTWNNFEQLTQYSAQCSDPTDAMTIPPIMYAYCNMSYACTNNSVSATYNYRVNMTVFCNKNSSTDAGTWIEVQTGQQLKTLNCTRVCRELVPPVGTKQISQTCAQAALYNLACKKDFSCIEETAPGSGTPPKNTAICRTVDGEARWVDSTTNAAYVGLSGCPSPKTGCLPIDHSNTTRVVNASCTPFPSGIHPENCKIDVECLAELRPVDLNDKENGEHVAECLKNNGTGNYEWFERTKGQWYIKHDCTKNCILNPSNTASNTTVIYPNGTTRVCNFNSVIPGTGKYYCGGKDIINVTCNLTCQLLKISGSLVFGSKPELIKESVVPIGGQYEIYCPNGYVWKGTTNTSKKYTCGADGKYTFGQETGVSIVVDLCEKPTTSKANCTLNLTDGHEVESSSCDTEDLIYTGGCLVTVQCKNGTYPNPKETPCQQRLCDPVSRQFVDPVTKGALKPYSCDQGYEAIKSCKDTIAPEGTQDYNYTCGPINLFGDNCMVSFKCKLGYYPKLVTDRKLLNRTAKCTYPRWIDILDGLEFKMFECIKGCLSDTSSLLQSTVQTREITQAGKTLKCNVTTYLGDERLYYCKAIDYASVSCPQTCPQLMVRSPLVTLVTPLNYVLNKVVLGGDKYIVSCPPGHIIEDRTIPDASSRPYICDSISGKYVNDFDEQVQEANFVCIPAGTGTCTLPQQPETITATSSCPTTTGSYVISCVVFLSCPTGSAPEQPDDQLFRQRVIQCQNKTGSGVNWIDLNSGLVAFKPYTCKAGCLQAEQTQTISSFLVGNTPTTCNISTIPVEAIQWQCPSSPALPDGTTKHDCSSGCRELQYKGQYFYVDVPSMYYHYVMFDSSYTFFCPPGAFFNNTEVYYQIFTCQKDGTYINPIGLPLSTLDAGCTEIPQGGLGQKQENVTITGRDGISEDPFIGISVVTSSLITPITPLPIIGDEAAATEDHVVPGEQAPEPVGELTVKPPTTSGCTLGRSQP